MGTASFFGLLARLRAQKQNKNPQNRKNVLPGGRNQSKSSLRVNKKWGLCQMVLMTSKTSLQKWSEVFLFTSVSPAFFQIVTVTYQHRLLFRWRGFMDEFLPLIRKA
ncbi:hypothetical protein [Ligilactobacillus ruminis]|uniref:hypothetical protein n=1 Tax=Ligilactobacillus ruminis TaxID=1623 RepID=UPI003F959F0C